MPRLVRWRTRSLNVADRDRINASERFVEQHVIGVGSPSARAISTRRRSPPESAIDGVFRRRAILNSSSSELEFHLAFFPGGGSTTSSTARIFCSTDRPRKIEASCGK